MPQNKRWTMWKIRGSESEGKTTHRLATNRRNKGLLVKTAHICIAMYYVVCIWRRYNTYLQYIDSTFLITFSLYRTHARTITTLAALPLLCLLLFRSHSCMYQIKFGNIYLYWYRTVSMKTYVYIVCFLERACAEDLFFRTSFAISLWQYANVYVNLWEFIEIVVAYTFVRTTLK